jgi:hypothetical protein
MIRVLLAMMTVTQVVKNLPVCVTFRKIYSLLRRVVVSPSLKPQN